MNVPERMQPIEPVPELNLEKELEPWKEELVALRSRYLRSSTPGRARKKKVTKKHRIYTQDMKLLQTVNTKGVQDPGLNSSLDILLRSSFFKDFTCEGIGHWILVMSCSFTGGSLKQEIIVILLFSLIGDAVEVPERVQPIEPVSELNPEKEKPVASSSNCLRSSAPGRARKKKVAKKCRIRTEDMIEDGPDESAQESVEDGCLRLGLMIDPN